ncbi:MAG TPA: pentapeptide repeat-containing protein, partial [Phycisphaerales bacterium]|nr:pentapeptide repeat-containing protein [Phycisphaerales bacterium]
SLGYGDIQPKGYFKTLAATEALLGLALMALFTVSWARKMVR